MAMSSDMAFSNAAKLAMVRGSAEASSCSYQRLARSTIRCPASRNSLSRSAWVASIDPLPGSDRPSASVRQFIELAVNMPEQLPQVGQAERSIASTSSSLYCSSAAARSEEHTSELQSLLRISYAVFCLNKKKTTSPSHYLGPSDNTPHTSHQS